MLRPFRPDTTLYNPWLGDKQGPVNGPDFDDDGYSKMVCIEPSMAEQSAVSLAPKQKWTGFQLIHVC